MNSNKAIVFVDTSGRQRERKSSRSLLFLRAAQFDFLSYFFVFIYVASAKSKRTWSSLGGKWCVCVPGTSVPLRCIAETEAAAAAVAESATNRPAKENERERESERIGETTILSAGGGQTAKCFRCRRRCCCYHHHRIVCSTLPKKWRVNGEDADDRKIVDAFTSFSTSLKHKNTFTRR